ncbi:HpcH/HpaI aldolase/citrate lyase family protein [Phenylobacterium koreense]|uniref:Citrate lyase subunit beta/citryl-CoA lyase n=2 Tax=Phenylobacterium TaxID=20 RepID=A0ABV2EJ32_9CAUL
MISARPRRSALYMPAVNARAIEKARELPCDVVILDLEDAVAPDAKEQARDQAAAAVAAGGFGRREVVIRINGLETPWGLQDLAASIEARPDAILVPKVSSAHDVTAYGAAQAAHIPLWAMIETCSALFALDHIAGAGAGLEALVVGTNDLAKEMRCRLSPARTALAGPLSLIIAAGRAYGLSVLDGVFNGIDDDAGLAAQCDQGVEFGFDGKTLVHPRQIETANRAFSPTGEEIAWSQAIVAAFDLPENAAKGVIKVEGRMVERLHLAEARRVIAVSEAIAAA